MLVCFGDESGAPVRCNSMHMSILCFERVPGLASIKHGSDLARELRRVLGLTRIRELKYRVVRKRLCEGVPLPTILRLFQERVAAWICVSIHVSNPSSARVELLRESVRALSTVARGNEVSMLVLDVQSVRDPRRVFAELRALGREVGIYIHRVEMKSSASVDGIQLADVLVGLCRDGLAPSARRYGR